MSEGGGDAEDDEVDPGICSSNHRLIFSQWSALEHTAPMGWSQSSYKSSFVMTPLERRM